MVSLLWALSSGVRDGGVCVSGLLACLMVSGLVGPPLYKLKWFPPCAALQQDDLASVFPLLAARHAGDPQQSKC